MINKFITFSCLTILSLCVTPVQAQPDSLYGYSIQHFTDENGLPQNSINDLVFDKDGFLWLASQVGLIRFTGSSFKLYYPDDKPIMESNVALLGRGSNGTDIYFQTTDHNLYCYPGNNSHLLSPVNTPAMQAPTLLNDRRQLFDFTHFLHPGRSGGQHPGGADREGGERHPGGAGSARESGQDSVKRQRIFRDLSGNNGNFFVIDSTHLYLRYSDTLYYYDDKDLLPLSGCMGNSLQYLAIREKFYILRADSVISVYEKGQKTGNSYAIGGDLRAAFAGRRHHPASFRLFTGDTDHLLADRDLYRIYVGSNGRLETKFLLRPDFATHITRIDYNTGLQLLIITTETDGFYFLHKSPFRSLSFPAPLQQQLSQYLFGPMALRDGREILTDQFIFDPSGKFSLVSGISPIWQKCLYVDEKEHVWSAVFNLPRQLTADMKVVKVFPAVDGQIVDYAEDEKGQLYCLTENSLWRLQADSFTRILNNAQLSVNGPNKTMRLAAPQIGRAHV